MQSPASNKSMATSQKIARFYLPMFLYWLDPTLNALFSQLFYFVQESGVTWWLSSPAGSPHTCISTVLLGRFPMRPRAATTPAVHSVVQVSSVQTTYLEFNEITNWPNIAVQFQYDRCEALIMALQLLLLILLPDKKSPQVGIF